MGAQTGFAPLSAVAIAHLVVKAVEAVRFAKSVSEEMERLAERPGDAQEISTADLAAEDQEGE